MGPLCFLTDGGPGGSSFHQPHPRVKLPLLPAPSQALRSLAFPSPWQIPLLGVCPPRVPSHGVVTYPGALPPPPPPLPTLAPCPRGWGARMGRGWLHSVCKGWATALAWAPQDGKGGGSAVGMEGGNGVNQRRDEVGSDRETELKPVGLPAVRKREEG